MQLVLASELVVALIMARHCHNGARAVVHQYIVADPDGYSFAGQRVQGADTSVHAQFFHGGHFGFRHLLGLALLNKLG